MKSKLILIILSITTQIVAQEAKTTFDSVSSENVKQKRLTASWGVDIGQAIPISVINPSYYNSGARASSGFLFKVNAVGWVRKGFGLGAQYSTFNSTIDWSKNFPSQGFETTENSDRHSSWSIGPYFNYGNKNIQIKAYLKPSILIVPETHFSADSGTRTNTRRENSIDIKEVTRTRYNISTSRFTSYGVLMGLNAEFRLTGSLWLRAGLEYSLYSGKHEIIYGKNIENTTSRSSETNVIIVKQETPRVEPFKINYINFFWGLVFNVNGVPFISKRENR